MSSTNQAIQSAFFDDSHRASELLPLEQEVLDEYARLRTNMNNFADILAELAANPSPQILEALRGLERKTSTVYTLLKASVYSMILNQQFDQGEEGQQQEGE